MLNVGWLGRVKDFKTGAVDVELWDELVRLVSKPVNVMRGLHDCDLCDVESPIRISSGYSANGFASLGTGEIWVKDSGNDVCYVAPTLLLHYMQIHEYLPPDEFTRAVRALRRRRLASAW
jgi:hypothetical protein